MAFCALQRLKTTDGFPLPRVLGPGTTLQDSYKFGQDAFTHRHRPISTHFDADIADRFRYFWIFARLAGTRRAIADLELQNEETHQAVRNPDPYRRNPVPIHQIGPLPFET